MGGAMEKQRKPAHRGRQDLPANAVKLDRKALQVRSVQQDHPAPKAIRDQQLRSASSPKLRSQP